MHPALERLAVAGLVEVNDEGQPLTGGLALAMLVATVPLGLRRRYPAVVAYVTIIASVWARLMLGHWLLIPVVAAMIALYVLVRHTSSGTRWLRVVPALAILAVPVVPDRWNDEASLVSLVALGTVAAGELARLRSEARRERAEAAARLVEAGRREAVLAERARIARELHDVVAHSVSVIAVQAEMAPFGIADLSPEAREGFKQIAGSARAAMTELRSVLDVLRGDGDGAGLAPQPGLDRLDDLLAQHRAAGGTVELTAEGERTPLAATVELTAYRIVQRRSPRGRAGSCSKTPPPTTCWPRSGSWPGATRCWPRP
jgi:signal transduction histidine kinase